MLLKKHVMTTCHGNFRSGKIEIAYVYVQKKILLYNFVEKCPNNSQNECKYTAIFGQLVICIVGHRFHHAEQKKLLFNKYFETGGKY